MITRDDVIFAYRAFLDIEPESEDAIQRCIKNTFSRRGLVNNFVGSNAYKMFMGSINYKRLHSLHRAMGHKSFYDAQKLIFLHINKTFGISFNNILIKNYAEKYCKSLGTVNFHYTVEDILDAIVIGGHIYYKNFCGTGKNKLFLSVVRDPIERAISWCNYSRPSVPFKYLVKSDIEFKENCANNTQCVYLSLNNTFESAISTIENNNFIVGCFEYAHEFVNTCANTLCWKYRDLLHLNKASNKKYKQMYYDDAKFIDYINVHNEDDIKLYNYIRERRVVNTIKNDFNISALYPKTYSY